MDSLKDSNATNSTEEILPWNPLRHVGGKTELTIQAYLEAADSKTENFKPFSRGISEQQYSIKYNTLLIKAFIRQAHPDRSSFKDKAFRELLKDR